MRKSIAIIGSGMGGLAAGIYGRLNGYETDIFEMHTIPGGQCTSWKRKGYTFDACIHHLFGCAPTTALYGLWEEVGTMPRDMVQQREVVSALSPDGKLFIDYYDPDLLEKHLNELAPDDGKVIRDYVGGVKSAARSDSMMEMLLGSRTAMLRHAPSMLAMQKWMKPTMAQFGERFSDPFLKRAFPVLVYSFDFVPVLVHLSRHGQGLRGELKWPIGGALPFALSMADRYKSLGGRIHFRSKVSKILTENGRAVGIRLEDGTEYRADYVVSDADGRTTIMEMLDGQFVDERIRGYCEPPDDELPWGVQVYLGVNRDLSNEPSSMHVLLSEPVSIANRTVDHVEIQMYGCDPTMAPAGKGVIKVELFSQYSYWKKLAEESRERYEEEKQRVADHAIDLLEKHYFTGLRQQVEVVDVPTLLTWERFIGATHGLGLSPKREMSVMDSVLGRSPTTRLPGLDSFRFVGTWATSAGSLFANVLSGKRLVKGLCKSDGNRFLARED